MHPAAPFQTTSYDWNYRIESQSHTMRGIRDRRPSWYAGKMLGGTSMLNAMIYMRGHKHDYDEWERLGCHGWGYESVLPFFKKAQKFQPDFDIDRKYHGTAGPYKVD